MAASYGARTAIIESDRVGGTCVIRGCVPKKLMMYAAGFGHALQALLQQAHDGFTQSIERGGIVEGQGVHAPLVTMVQHTRIGVR